MPTSITRRTFLTTASGAAAALTQPWLAWAADAAANSDTVLVPGKSGMIVRSFRFLDLEMPMAELNSAKNWITPTGHFFVRNHMSEPVDIDPAEWRLEVGGEVDNPIKLSLKDIEKLPVHTILNTLECAGNGRGLQRPQVPGVQWE